MASPHVGFERRVLSAIEAAPSRIPVIVSGCGTGRTSLAQRVRDRVGIHAAQYVDVERCATTPERFVAAVIGTSPFRWTDDPTPPRSARAAFDRLLAFLSGARAGGGPATFVLDEVLELRTFESFPGLRHVLKDLLDTLATSTNRFVLTSRYTARAHRWLRDATARFEVVHLSPLGAAEVAEVLAPSFDDYEQTPSDERDDMARAVQCLADGRLTYVDAIGRSMARMGRGRDPLSALTSLLAPGGDLDEWCRFRYELRLHRARGYGALKAILDILALEEPLTLTEISQRLWRTPGSTKDYLSWLEDVDLVTSRQKRYSFTDPLLRLWVGLHCRPVPPSVDEVAHEVQRYAAQRLPAPTPASRPELAYAGIDVTPDERKSWGIIEID